MKERTYKMLMASILTAVLTASCTVPNQNNKELPTNAEVTTASETTTITTFTSTTAVTTTVTEVTTIEETTEVTTETELITLREEESIIETDSPVTEILIETEPIVTESYVVYKPSTHYLHMNSCRWNSGDAYRVDCTTELVARLCDECCPDISDFIEYVEPEPEISNDYYNLTDDEIFMLRNVVSYEYGSDWVSVYEKSKIVSAVMNRVKEGRWGGTTIYEVLTASGQFPGFYPYGDYYMSDSIIAAVEYYFAHPDDYGYYNSWRADGNGYNYFYCA